MPILITYLKLIGAVLAWGGTFIAAKYAVQDTSVEMAALLRFSSAALVLNGIVYLKLGHWPRLNLAQVFYISLLGLSGITVYNLFFFSGLQTVEAGRGALIITSNPVWVTLGSVLFFKQSLKGIHILGLILCIFGVTLVLTRGQPQHLLQGEIGAGELTLLGSALAWAVYTLLGKRLMHSRYPLDPLTMVAYSCISGSLLLVLWIVMADRSFDAHVTITLLSSIGYLSLLGTVAGFVWYFEGVKILGAAQGSVFIFFVPVSAILMGWLMLNEPITLSLITGAMLILGGVYLVNRPAKVLTL